MTEISLVFLVQFCILSAHLTYQITALKELHVFYILVTISPSGTLNACLQNA